MPKPSGCAPSAPLPIARRALGNGTVAATVGDTVVMGTGTSWQTWNRGRGDVITIDAVNYMVLRVDSQTQLQLATPFTGTTASGKSYFIARQFTTLAAWETCISGGACTYFPVASADLVLDNRTEIGIAYKDTVFTLSSTVLINGSTTDPTHRIQLTADPGNRHNGVPGAGVVVNNNGANEVDVRDSYVTVEWLELTGASGLSISPIQVSAFVGENTTNVVLQNLLVHNFADAVNDISGIDLAGDNTVARGVTIRNCMIWDGDEFGIEGDGSLDTLIIENVSIDGMLNRGIHASGSPLTIRNTIVTGSGNEDYGVGAGGTLSGSNNTSSDGTAAFGANAQTLVSAASVFVLPGSDLHLKLGGNVAVNTALDLSGSFWNDIDDKSRFGLTWDRGAHERGAVTAVELVSFTASAADGEVVLQWETGSEYDNLGFRLYRAFSWEGPYESITKELVPGLGSSPEGARYSYLDRNLENGVAYFYQLEDVETTGRTERHGPVAATPDSRSGRTESDPAVITYGAPDASELHVVESARDHIVMELWTGGFRAAPVGDGTVRIEAPGFEATQWLLSRRASVDAPAGRNVRLASWEALDVEVFAGLTPRSVGRPEVDARRDGTVRARRAPALLEPSVLSMPSVELAGVAFQGDSKKAFVELRPFGRDASGHLVLARRLRFTLSFRGRDARERTDDGGRGRRYRPAASHRSRAVVARLATRDRGLYALPFAQMGGRRSYATGNLKLTRLGETRPYFVEPDPRHFGPGSTLYFLSEGGAHNPYGHEAVFELQEGSPGTTMRELPVTPKDAPNASFYWETSTHEENRFYQAALLEAEDLWLWESLFAPQTRSFAFTLDEIAIEADDATLSLWLQGASDFPAAPDHHVRVSVNGVFLTESHWDGKQPRHLETPVPISVLRDGENSLELEGVGDTDAAYSMVFLDRFEVRYPRRVVMRDGYLEGLFRENAAVEVGASFVLDVTGEPVRIRGESGGGTVRFAASAGRSYVLVSEARVRRPELRRARGERLKSTLHSADYVVVGPNAFLEAARPLLELRRRQGLAVKAVAIEDVYSEFGFGETRPEALRDFLSYAYHRWRKPPRYVLLLGDGTYDFKDYLGTGAMNRVPPLMVKTSYLWTASDPAYASVNGDDFLPDLAIGRLPASTLEEVERLVSKILAYESLATGADPTAVLVADDSDNAGDFEGDADSLAGGVLSKESVRTIYLGRLGIDAAREEILDSFDEGASTLSYVGHGGIYLWASENLFDRESVGLLSAQPRQPIVLTMNCLNGYFHFPFFNALSEELLKAEGKGAIAAFSPSGLSLNEPAHLLHQALLRELHSGTHRRLGDAVAAAQASYADSGTFPELLLIYHLLGDPALTLR